MVIPRWCGKLGEKYLAGGVNCLLFGLLTNLPNIFAHKQVLELLTVEKY
jgi:hypothetical protein